MIKEIVGKFTNIEPTKIKITDIDFLNWAAATGHILAYDNFGKMRGILRKMPAVSNNFTWIFLSESTSVSLGGAQFKDIPTAIEYAWDHGWIVKTETVQIYPGWE